MGEIRNAISNIQILNYHEKLIQKFKDQTTLIQMHTLKPFEIPVVTSNTILLQNHECLQATFLSERHSYEQYKLITV